jgi:hypothetical protein
MRVANQLLGRAAAIMLVTIAVANVEGGASTKVTTRLLMPADSVAPVFFSDSSQSGTDTYVTTSGKNGVSSILQPGGDWQLDTQSAGRAVWLDLDDPTLPFSGQFVHALLTTHCGLRGATTTPVAFLTGVGNSTTCPMSFRINWGSSSSVFYRFHFNSINHPGTGDVTFTCNQVGANNSCIDWSAEPADNEQPASNGSVSGDGRSAGQLVKVTSTRAGEIETLVGYYNISFNAEIVRP